MNSSMVNELRKRDMEFALKNLEMNFSVKLWNSFSTTLTYKGFVDEYMEKWEEEEMNETDEEFNTRCFEAWKKVLNDDADVQFEDEEADDQDGDARIQELSRDCIWDAIMDSRVEKYNKIYEERIRREQVEKKERENKRKEDAMKECLDKMRNIAETQDLKEKRIADLKAQLSALGVNV